MAKGDLPPGVRQNPRFDSGAPPIPEPPPRQPLKPCALRWLHSSQDNSQSRRTPTAATPGLRHGDRVAWLRGLSDPWRRCASALLPPANWHFRKRLRVLPSRNAFEFRGLRAVWLRFSRNALEGLVASLVSKGYVQPRGHNNVILLLARRRISHKNVSECVLPAQPLADFGHRAKVECGTVLTRIAQVGKEIELLFDHCAGVYFMHKLFAQGRGGEIPTEKRILLSRVVRAP